MLTIKRQNDVPSCERGDSSNRGGPFRSSKWDECPPEYCLNIIDVPRSQLRLARPTVTWLRSPGQGLVKFVKATAMEYRLSREWRFGFARLEPRRDQSWTHERALSVVYQL
jgi:hypothetical protein